MVRLLKWVRRDSDEYDDWHWYQERDLFLGAVVAVFLCLCVVVGACLLATLPKPLSNWGAVSPDPHIESVTLCEGGTSVDTVTPDKRNVAAAVEWDMLESALRDAEADYDDEGASPLSGNTAAVYAIDLGNPDRGADAVYVLDAGHAWINGRAYLLLDDGKLYQMCADLFAEGESASKGNRD